MQEKIVKTLSTPEASTLEPRPAGSTQNFSSMKHSSAHAAPVPHCHGQAHSMPVGNDASRIKGLDVAH